MARGSIRRRGSMYYAYWREPDGTQRSKAVSPRKKDAEAFLARVQGEIAAGDYSPTVEIGFSDFAVRFIRDYASVHVKPSTLATYRSRALGIFSDQFGNQPLSSIKPAEVQRFVADRLYDGRAAATVRHYVTQLKLMFRVAVDWGYLKHSPAEKVKLPRIQHREMDFLTPAEARLLLAEVDEEHTPLITTALMTGMRMGELLALQWSDIDWNSRTIRVRRSLYRGEYQDPKSVRSIRRIGMSRHLATVLRQHRLSCRFSEDDLLFPSTEGTPMDSANVRQRIFEPALRRAGLRKVRFHDLRHSFASMLINQGENLKYVQSQLGHASIQITVDRYGHLMPDAHLDATDRLDATLFGEDAAANPVDNLLTRSA